jgi:hypothetical protein
MNFDNLLIKINFMKLNFYLLNFKGKNGTNNFELLFNLIKYVQNPLIT